MCTRLFTCHSRPRIQPWIAGDVELSNSNAIGSIINIIVTTPTTTTPTTTHLHRNAAAPVRILPHLRHRRRNHIPANAANFNTQNPQ